MYFTFKEECGFKSDADLKQAAKQLKHFLPAQLEHQNTASYFE